MAETLAAPVVSYGIDNRQADDWRDRHHARRLWIEGNSGYGAVPTAATPCWVRSRSTCPAAITCSTRSRSIAAASHLGVTFAAIAAALAEFRGAERRFERKGEANGRIVVDDYGHHPTEIAAVLMRCARHRRPPHLLRVPAASLLAHRSTCCSDFGPALALADEVLLTDIYPAGEDPIPGVDHRRARRTKSGNRCPDPCTSSRDSRTFPRP